MYSVIKEDAVEENLGQPLRSLADPGSDVFARNHAENAALAAELRERLEQVRLGGSEQARKRHTARGKLLPRDRVDTLCSATSWARRCFLTVMG
jgi:hypothetical protein